MKKIILSTGILVMLIFNQTVRSQSVFINEIHYDNDGTDSGEAIEIAGPAGTNLNGWNIVLYNGSGGAVYTTTPLSGTLADMGSGYGFQTINYPSNGIQNGSPDGIALVDNFNVVIQFLSYEGTFVASGGPANGMSSTDIGVAESTSTLLGHSLQLTGTGTKYTDFTWAAPATNTFGAVNNGQTFGTPSGATAAFIHDIQGAGMSSPMSGQTVIIEGIVTGDFQATASGFYVQEEDADADASILTSEGIFVYAPGAIDVNTGDKVKVTGSVTEFFDLTEINNVTNIQVVSTSNSLPAITLLTLPHPSVNFLERYEGMYVQYNQSLMVTNNYLLGRGGELTLSSADRLYQPTQIVDPGTAAVAQQDLNKLNSIVIDDASTAQNPDPVIFPAPGMDFNNTVRGGYGVSNVKGVMTYSWSGFTLSGQPTDAYRVYVTEDPVFDALPNPRQTQPDAVGGNLKVASFNVLNYFNGNGQGGGFPTSRGAETFTEFNRQRDKIINAIVEMDADIIGLMEIENDGYGAFSAIQDLVNGLNAAGTATYNFVNPGVSQIGTDEIAVGLLYKTGLVNLYGSPAILDKTIDPLFDSDFSRPALAQSFTDIASGEILTVCVNHLKSKGSDCNSTGDPDVGDGQGNCNQTRKNAAIALVNWLSADPTGSGSAYNMIIGDLNSYAKEDPIVEIENGGYVNLLRDELGFQGYSYSFDGQWGTLDYAFASSALTSFVTGATAWHINADEAAVLDYNVNFKSAGQINSFYSTDPHRASDHDPIVVGIEFPQSAFKFNAGLLNNIGSNWQTVNLGKTYNSMVVIASVILPSGIESKPAVTRIKNATGSSFEIRVQNPSNELLSGYSVYYLVVEEGVYTEAEHGIKMEAVRTSSEYTASRGFWWWRETRNYTNSYKSPVVVGQVMTANDDNWSVFWASANNNSRKAPVKNSFACGKHVGENLPPFRANEDIGYLVIEEGSGVFGNKSYVAALGKDQVRGVQNDPSGYAYQLSGFSTADIALVSSAGMDGKNGGWPVITGNSGLTANKLLLNIDEDQTFDYERRHVKEQVACLVLGDAELLPRIGSSLISESVENPENEDNMITQSIVVSMYPNPTRGQFMIHSAEISGKGTISVYHLNGNLVRQQYFNATHGMNEAVDLGTITEGIYVVQIEHTAGVEIKKLIISNK